MGRGTLELEVGGLGKGPRTGYRAAGPALGSKGVADPSRCQDQGEFSGGGGTRWVCKSKLPHFTPAKVDSSL